MTQVVARGLLFAVLAATGVDAQSTQSAQITAAVLCAEGQQLLQQGNYEASEKRFLAAIAESEKNLKTTELRGGCLVQLAQAEVKQKKYVNAEASARRAVAIFERFPFEGNLGLSTAIAHGAHDAACSHCLGTYQSRRTQQHKECCRGH
jgi:outer membrane protein assembly factor BamD (BamD/ComL family)